MLQSHLVRGVWIEIDENDNQKKKNKSHLVRGVWIEMNMTEAKNNDKTVTLRKGCVDRNNTNIT